MTEKDKEAMRRICAMFGQMPYGGSIGFQYDGADTTLEMVESNLKKLREALLRQCDQDNDKDKELSEFREMTRGIAILFRKIGAVQERQGEPGEKMYNFEIALAGYNGDTDETDHLVKWLRAPSLMAVKRFVKDNRLPLDAGGISKMQNQQQLTRADGIDVFLSRDGHMFTNGDIDRVQKWVEESEAITKR